MTTIKNDNNDKDDNDDQAASILKAKTTERASCAEQESHVRSFIYESYLNQNLQKNQQESQSSYSDPI